MGGRHHQLKKVWLKNNFLSEYHKLSLYQKMQAVNAAGTVYVDDFENVNLLTKEFIDRSIWVSPMPANMLGQEKAISAFFSEQYECGFIVDVRMGKGRSVPGRIRENVYC